MTTAQRRRGAELEAALLDAAWEELKANGYAGFTFDAVAQRAGTSRPVLYRRWSDRGELIRAAVAHVLERDRIAIPDTGTLRGDVLAAMVEVNRTRAELATVMSVHLGEYYRETNTSPADLKSVLAPGRQSAAETIFARAIERGEVDPQRLTARVRALPFDLLRHELLMTRSPLAPEALEEIVDTIFLPLVVAPREQVAPDRA